jgi:hypothetical protein
MPQTRRVLVSPLLLLAIACAAPGGEAAVITRAVAPADLLAGAQTYVPASANPGYVDVDGAPFAIDTRITAVQFHVPGVPSGAPGGLSSTPHPVLIEENGVSYYRVSGELSGTAVDYGGLRYVVGPIGPDGVDHRFDADRTHPRGQLAGAFFILRYPVHGANGALINHQSPNDGGFWYPAAALLDVPLDTTLLLARGYSLFTVALGGTVHRGLIGDEVVVDTNPDSGSGVFWGGELQSYLRPARIDADGVETAFPQPSLFPRWVPDLGGTVEIDVGLPDFGTTYGVVLQWQPELLRDGIVVGKRLLQRLTGASEPPWTAFLGWSGSGGTADALNGGVVNGVLSMPPGKVPSNGGNFNVFHEPSSGRRFDAFVVFAGGGNWVAFDGGDWQLGPVDDRYPAGAPMVYIAGDADATASQFGGYLFANQLARALPGSAQADTPMEELLALYIVRGLTHLTHDYLYANARNQGRNDFLYYLPDGTFPNEDGFNRDRRGRQVGAIWVEAGFLDTFGLTFLHDVPRTTPLFLQSFENLRALTTHGTPLPESRVEADLFARLDDLEPGARCVGLPAAPCPLLDWSDPDLDLAQAMISCAAVVTQDSQLIELGGCELIPLDLEVLREFAGENPLRRRHEPLEVPDMAAALGPRLYWGPFALERRLGDAELRAGYLAPDGRLYQLTSHGDYVDRFRAATDALVAERLWDARLGAQYVAEAARSDVLLD